MTVARETLAMPFREKEAWLELVAMLLAYGGYFALVIATPGEAPGLRFVVWFAVATAARLAIQFGGRAVLARQNPAEARAPADERDRAIARHGLAAGYGVLLVAMVLVAVLMPLGGAEGWEIANAGLFAIVVAETVRDLVVVTHYRRGWHG